MSISDLESLLQRDRASFLGEDADPGMNADFNAGAGAEGGVLTGREDNSKIEPESEPEPDNPEPDKIDELINAAQKELDDPVSVVMSDALRKTLIEVTKTKEINNDPNRKRKTWKFTFFEIDPETGRITVSDPGGENNYPDVNPHANKNAKHLTGEQKRALKRAFQETVQQWREYQEDKREALRFQNEPEYKNQGLYAALTEIADKENHKQPPGTKNKNYNRTTEHENQGEVILEAELIEETPANTKNTTEDEPEEIIQGPLYDETTPEELEAQKQYQKFKKENPHLADYITPDTVNKRTGFTMADTIIWEQLLDGVLVHQIAQDPFVKQKYPTLEAVKARIQTLLEENTFLDKELERIIDYQRMMRLVNTVQQRIDDGDFKQIPQLVNLLQKIRDLLDTEQKTMKARVDNVYTIEVTKIAPYVIETAETVRATFLALKEDPKRFELALTNQEAWDNMLSEIVGEIAKPVTIDMKSIEK